MGTAFLIAMPLAAAPLHAQGLVGGIVVDSATVRLTPPRRHGRPACALVMNQPFNFSLKP